MNINIIVHSPCVHVCCSEILFVSESCLSCVHGTIYFILITWACPYKLYFTYLI